MCAQLTHLAAYHTTVRGLMNMRAHRHAGRQGRGAEYAAHQRREVSFAHKLSSWRANRTGLAGGLLVTAPAEEDLTSEGDAGACSSTWAERRASMRKSGCGC